MAHVGQELTLGCICHLSLSHRFSQNLLCVFALCDILNGQDGMFASIYKGWLGSNLQPGIDFLFVKQKRSLNFDAVSSLPRTQYTLESIVDRAS